MQRYCTGLKQGWPVSTNPESRQVLIVSSLGANPTNAAVRSARLGFGPGRSLKIQQPASVGFTIGVNT